MLGLVADALTHQGVVAHRYSLSGAAWALEGDPTVRTPSVDIITRMVGHRAVRQWRSTRRCSRRLYNLPDAVSQSIYAETWSERLRARSSAPATLREVLAGVELRTVFAAETHMAQAGAARAGLAHRRRARRARHRA